MCFPSKISGQNLIASATITYMPTAKPTTVGCQGDMKFSNVRACTKLSIPETLCAEWEKAGFLRKVHVLLPEEGWMLRKQAQRMFPAWVLPS